MKHMPRIICLSGWKGSGKDETAKVLGQLFGYQRLAMADKLKDEVAQIYGLDRRVLDDRILKETPLLNLPVINTDPFSATIHQMLSSELSSGYWTPRALCILEGSIKRAVASSHWLKALEREILAHPNRRYVITDMRYRSEARFFKAAFGQDVSIWRIMRSDHIDTMDPSERDLDNYEGFDVIIKNQGALSDLQVSIVEVIGNKTFDEEKAPMVCLEAQK